MNKKYVMLYNFDHDEYGTKMIDAVLTMFPEAKVEDYTICSPHGEFHLDYDGISIWIPEEQFLACWMFVNTLNTDEIENTYIEEFLMDYTIDDAIEYMNNHLKQPELYVKYYN